MLRNCGSNQGVQMVAGGRLESQRAISAQNAHNLANDRFHTTEVYSGIGAGVVMESRWIASELPVTRVLFSNWTPSNLL